MVDTPISFSDGASYELMMGEWSRSAGADFLNWLQPAPALAWLDVGCGSGAFSSLVVERCAPLSLLGIDPSEGQLSFARTRGLGAVAMFKAGDAMEIDLPENSVDVAVAALVLHFMPDPLRGVREMARVVRPSGVVSAYTWDLEDNGFPYEAVHRAMREVGLEMLSPPHPEAGNADEQLRLWTAAGLDDVRQREISVFRTFSDFDQYWKTATISPRIAAGLAELAPDQIATLQEVTRSYLPESSVFVARANAISGRVS